MGETQTRIGSRFARNNNLARRSEIRGDAAYDSESKNYHAPKHWHTANETHTVIGGTFIMQHDGGKPEELGPGSYNRMPSKMIHEAWSKPDEGNLVFITVDGPWDLNLVEGPAAKMPPAK